MEYAVEALTVKWDARYHKTGNVAPCKIGGYKPKTLRGAWVWLVARCQEKDFTITSPDLNPIEQVFSKLKHLLRKMQVQHSDAILRHQVKSLEPPR